MPMIPEAAVAMLACARLGAIHSVVFGGFAAHELAIRIDHAQPRVLVTASGAIEGKKTLGYKPLIDEAISQSDHKPEKCIIFQREFITSELIRATTFTGVEQDITQRMEAMRDGGLSQLVIPIVPGHEDAIEDWGRIAKAFR